MQAKWTRAVKNLPTARAKILALAALNATVRDIATFLQLAPEIVEDVVKADNIGLPTGMAEAPFVSDWSSQPGAPSSHVAESVSPDDEGARDARVQGDGSIRISSNLARQFGVSVGDTLTVTLVDGSLLLAKRPPDVRKARSLVRQFISPSVSLVEDLFEERHRHAD